ncbi:MAG: TetR/AcrR family transcriptional regulator [Bacillota bacterium]|uniref:TetR/AcrR family transcriptional regulator n=1 Tax=Virgibacillus salarius TaxID=447199 RepID=A0A941DX56_9BACI|nr:MULTISPECIES: TetR/AcrR family transcriptional regulator [Bacillaceae]NAZ07815.1 TetR family transcriptional regulator [Agaribacter marinus]MBR7795098.1 TetR/AcrR family transcriptional regulator [Virgibacillus salarius]MCC2248398.1 TetR/AcrR family transcriptional regulator [Virgibacillus sp. AGTR]MDY7045449.1 TetR/AcrR family transcriptional regulator [Virgibacillus sp. M23]QRZ16737.1 TetR/AcrR family transcriptional regulator [Virgibacillus sp. AGTR]
MNPQDRWKQERMEGKMKRRNSIILAAEKVFAKKGFDNTTMQEIADEENIGIATVFRYFPKKEKLIVAVAINIVEKYIPIFQSIADMNGSCLDKMERMFDFFISEINEEKLENMQLLEVFKSYASLQTEPLEDIEAYNRSQNKISVILASIIEDGKQDGSIRSDIDIKKVLTTITNSFGLFSRKLLLYERIPMLKGDLEAEEQLKILKNIFIDYLQPS